MGIDTRQFIIGLLTLGALLLLFIGYTQLQNTPDLDTPPGAGPQEGAMNTISVPDQDGEVAGINVPIIEEVTFIHRGADGTIDREFGFAEKLHQIGNNWEVLKPFMKVYLPHLKCSLTADRGSLELESAAGRYTPKEAAFAGNVVIHIQPQIEDMFAESYIYMDNITFISDRSRFSSAGDLAVASDRLQLEGRGIELVYNDLLGRIQYLRLNHLQRLCVKSPPDKLLFTNKGWDLADQPSPGEGTPGPLPEDANNAVSPRPGTYYQCAFKGNAAVKTPEQLILARKMILLKDIFWPGAAVADFMDANLAGDDAEPCEPNHPQPVFKEANEPMMEVVITCDQGIDIVPMEVNQADITTSLQEDVLGDLKSLHMVDSTRDQALFVADAIHHSTRDQRTTASGPLALTFYTSPSPSAEVRRRLIPVQVTAQERAGYSDTANQIMFQGDCSCTLREQDANTVRQYTLEAPRLTIDLLDDKDRDTIAATTDLKCVRADGGGVSLRIISAQTSDRVPSETDLFNQAGKPIVGAEMLCEQCDYHAIPGQELITATGPGEIRLNNSQAQVTSGAGRPCYAFLRHFQDLRYNIQDNRIVADAGSQQMLFDYFPVVDGRYERHIKAQAEHLEILLIKTGTGEIDLANLIATGNVSYEDTRHQFTANGLSYDHSHYTMEMWGRENQPCYANGVPVKRIQFNLKTGQLNTELPGSGVSARK